MKYLNSILGKFKSLNVNENKKSKILKVKNCLLKLEKDFKE